LDDTRGEFTFINKLGSSVIDCALPSEGIINNILYFKTGVEIISVHKLLLLEIENITEETNNNTNITCQTQLQKLMRYKWNNKHKLGFSERLNDNAWRIYMCGIQYIITKGNSKYLI
jgi:hypothetical protein